MFGHKSMDANMPEYRQMRNLDFSRQTGLETDESPIKVPLDSTAPFKLSDMVSPGKRVQSPFQT